MKMYEMIWRNKWLTSDAKSIDDMIDSLTDAIKQLQGLKDLGNNIEVDFESASDDYIFFRTEDANLAFEYDMSESENYEEEV